MFNRNQEAGGKVRVDKRTASLMGAIVVAGLVLTAIIFFIGPRGDSGTAVAEEGGALEYPRGPNGARLLSDTSLQLEMTIYETGVPPRFRVYPFNADLKPVAPNVRPLFERPSCPRTCAVSPLHAQGLLGALRRALSVPRDTEALIAYRRPAAIGRQPRAFRAAYPPAFSSAWSVL